MPRFIIFFGNKGSVDFFGLMDIIRLVVAIGLFTGFVVEHPEIKKKINNILSSVAIFVATY